VGDLDKDPEELVADLDSVAGPHERRQKIAQSQSLSGHYAALREIANNTRAIKGWIIFFGILVILAIISQICAALAAIAKTYP